MNKQKKTFLTVQETATLLSVSVRTIYRYVSTGKLKGYRVAGDKIIRIRRQDIDNLLHPI